MRNLRWFAGVIAVVLAALPVRPGVLGPRHELNRVNRRLHGRVVDHTHNHGADCRIWSPALCQKRDLYVYLPPHFDPSRRYPLAVYLHGATQDEQFFLACQVQLFDQAIACGKMAPIIVAAPDGSIHGRPSLLQPASFFANSRAGAFEDFLMHDVWNFVMQNYPIRPEREARALVGVSMGGSAAFAHAIKYKDRLQVAIGFFPALNVRWVDGRGRYKTKFHPDDWGWRTQPRLHEPVGHSGLYCLTFGLLFRPMFGHGPEVIAGMSAINPIEMLDSYNLREGEICMYVAYGGRDQFNIDTEVESFLYRARERGLTVDVAYDPHGRHDLATGIKLFPAAIDWVAPKVARFSQEPRVEPGAEADAWPECLHKFVVHR